MSQDGVILFLQESDLNPAAKELSTGTQESSTLIITRSSISKLYFDSHTSAQDIAL